jgi:dolichyl-phosphate-mannose-protein mannosyltransferase
MISSEKYKKYVLYLIFISILIRGILAGILELGNDEVYYRLYALYPDWSHFDHPLMVGLFIRFTTLDFLFHNEFFIRLGSVIAGAINIWIVYKIGSHIKDQRTGYFSALLYTTSIYASIITGVFILPDTPQSLFWLWAVYIMIKTLPESEKKNGSGINILTLGVLIGFGILSKYTSVFLWIGAGLYILLYNRKWLGNPLLYISVFLTVIISLPILIWNIQNDFISFTFHSNRVDVSGYGIDPDYFFTELIGEILYNNPVNYFLILIGIIAVFRGRLTINRNFSSILLFSGLPLIITFLVFSLFRRTLPHWTAPGITTLIPLAAVYISQKYDKHKGIPKVIIISAALVIITIILGITQINFGLISFDNSREYHRIGKNDPSLDMFGYKQAGDSFMKIVDRDINMGLMQKNSILIGTNWFPLANFDYYAATPAGIKSYGIGDLSRIHKYAWINIEHGGFRNGMDAYYLTDSREYNEPDKILYDSFEHIIPADTIQVYRGKEVVKRVFVFRLKNMINLPANVLE